MDLFEDDERLVVIIGHGKVTDTSVVARLALELDVDGLAGTQSRRHWALRLALAKDLCNREH